VLAAAKRAADSSGAKVSPALRSRIDSVQAELAAVTRELGAANGGRGGRGGFGSFGGLGGFGGLGSAPIAGSGRGGRGGRGVENVVQSGAPSRESAAIAASAGQAAAGAAATDQDQNPIGPSAPETLQAKLGTTTEMLNVNFNPNAEQKQTVRALPGELAREGARVKKVAGDDLPALIKALRDAGVDVKTP